MNWKLILERLLFWDSQDSKWQKAMNEFCKTIAPNEYVPILSPNYAMSFIEGIGGKDKSNNSIYDWLTYWLYEARDMEECEVIDVKGNKYNFKKREEVIKFFENSFN